MVALDQHIWIKTKVTEIYGKKIYISRVCLFTNVSPDCMFLLDPPPSSNSWFSNHNGTNRFCSARASLCCDRIKLFRWSYLFKLLPANQIQGTNWIKANLSKNTAHIPRQRQTDRVKKVFYPAIRHAPNRVKKSKNCLFAKMCKPWGSISSSLKTGEILAIRKNLASFWNWGWHLFYATCWHLYRFYREKYFYTLLFYKNV